jgi:hypothetical protein
MLKKNLKDDAWYWVVLNEPTEIAGKLRPAGQQFRLQGSTVKVVFSCCGTITPALLEG